MDMSRSKLCAIALLTTTLTLVSNLAGSQAQMLERSDPNMRNRTFQTTGNYKGPICIFIGPLQEGTPVIVDWGPYEGTGYIRADRGQNELYAVQIDADGGDVPFTVYVHKKVNSNFPEMSQMPCDSDQMQIKVFNPFYLQWRWRR